MHITGCWHCQEPQNTARQIRTLPTVERVPNVPRERALDGSMLKPELAARRQPLTRPPSPRWLHDYRRLALEDYGPEDPLLFEESVRRSTAELRESKKGVRRGVRKAFTGSTCSPWLVQSISNCRAKRGRAGKNWPKMGVVSHSCAHFPEQVKEVLIGN